MNACLTLNFLSLLAVPALLAKDPISPATHPDVSAWETLFAKDLSNAEYPPGVWTLRDGVLTATEDQCIWTQKTYENFTLDLEFKTDHESNSGVVVYCTDKENWIPNSIEIQIADDHSEKWAKSPKSWQCGAIFGHLPARKSLVKKPGDWNRFTITCRGPNVHVILNGEPVTELDMTKWTSAKTNPDGSDIPAWLNRPVAQLKTAGFIGLQGKHAGAPIYFRNIKIKRIE